ncbi:MAG: hypothetical protein AAF004_01365 [Pseudomonadota bacterium]
MKHRVYLIAATSLLVVGCANGPVIDGDELSSVDTEAAQTGSRLPASGDRENPRDVEVIDRDDIENSGATSIHDAIRRRGKNR